MKIKFDRELVSTLITVGAGLGIVTYIQSIENKAELALQRSKGMDMSIDYLFEKSRMLNNMILDTDVKLVKLEKMYNENKEEE